MLTRIEIHNTDQQTSKGRQNPVQPQGKQVLTAKLYPNIRNKGHTDKWDEVAKGISQEDAEKLRYPGLTNNQQSSIPRGFWVATTPEARMKALAYSSTMGSNAIEVVCNVGGMALEEVSRLRPLGISNGEVDATDPKALPLTVAIHGIETVVNCGRTTIGTGDRFGLRAPAVVKDEGVIKPMTKIHNMNMDMYVLEPYPIKPEVALHYMQAKLISQAESDEKDLGIAFAGTAVDAASKQLFSLASESIIEFTDEIVTNLTQVMIHLNTKALYDKAMKDAIKDAVEKMMKSDVLWSQSAELKLNELLKNGSPAFDSTPAIFLRWMVKVCSRMTAFYAIKVGTSTLDFYHHQAVGVSLNTGKPGGRHDVFLT